MRKKRKGKKDDNIWDSTTTGYFVPLPVRRSLSPSGALNNLQVCVCVCVSMWGCRSELDCTVYAYIHLHTHLRTVHTDNAAIVFVVYQQKDLK